MKKLDFHFTGFGLSALLLPILLAGMALASCNKIEDITDYDGIFTDPRDSSEYPYVVIGDQTWMAKNMKIKLGDGTDSWCFASNEDNCDTYGRLYTWEKAMQACPKGWHVPTDGEWKKLEIYAGMDASDADSTDWRVSGSTGIALKAKKGWNSGGNGENTVRFSAIPSGIYEKNGYYYIGDLTTFWSSTRSDETHVWGRALIYHADGVYRWKYTKTAGYSVRCLKD